MVKSIFAILSAVFIQFVSSKSACVGSCPVEKGTVLIQRHYRGTFARTSDARSGDDQLKVHLHDEGLANASASITIVSYNLYWWNVKANNRWGDLYGRIKKQAPFDLIGFQECEDVKKVIRGSGLDTFDYYQGPNKPSNNPAPLAWNRNVFTVLAGPDKVWVASDRYGGRYMTWVRLNHIASGTSILFANTHGPLGNCGSTLGKNWANGIKDNKAEGDVVFLTGDYNCWTGTSAMRILKDSLINDDIHDIDGGIDQIITDFGFKESGGKQNGWPSDHPLIKGTFHVGDSEALQKLRKECCGNCAGSPWCSPGSGSCYQSQNKPYYESCPVDPTPAPPPTPPTPAPVPACCRKCAGSPWCSPGSGNCYQSQNKPHYESCPFDPTPAPPPTPTPAPVAACCRKCAGSPWCSPGSGNCYATQNKPHYESCPVDPTPAPPPADPSTCNPASVQRRRRNGDMCACRRRSAPSRGLKCAGNVMAQDEAYVATSERSSIRFMSYNLMGWAGCNSRPDRGANMFEKIYNWDPAVLGAQEVETGGGRGWDACASKISAGGNVTTGGGSQFFNPDVVEKHEGKEREILKGKGYWISMTRYQHKRTQNYFLFFNSHWKHGYGHEQAREVGKFINEQRVKYNSEPTILVGDTNQFCRAYDLFAYRYLTGKEGSSPVIFSDVHPEDHGRSFGNGGDCRVDFILASEGQWSVNSAEIDRDGMGQSGWASDHAALKAELSIKSK